MSATIGGGTNAAAGRSREELAAELLARFGIDPDSPEHAAAARRQMDAL